MQRLAKGKIKKPSLERKLLKASEDAYEYVTRIAMEQITDRIDVLDQIIARDKARGQFI